MRVLSGFASAVLFVLLAAAPPAHAQLAQVRGTVTDADDRPVPGVNVVLTKEGGGTQVTGTSTANDGTFRIEGVSPGPYRLVASAVGYAEATRTVTLEAGTTRRVSLQLRTARYGLDEVVVSATRTQ
jgi:iron complex outermembrane receptor protein